MLTVDPPPGWGEDSPVRRTTLEVEDHVAAAGWDQPARLFALVETATLLRAQPELADQLGAADGFTPIEQELRGDQHLEELLPQIAWPADVDGCAVAMERVTLPPEAEMGLPDDPAAAVEYAAAHPDRREMRIVAAVLRDGSAHVAVRGRVPADAPLLEGPDLLPPLVRLLHDTLIVDNP